MTAPLVELQDIHRAFDRDRGLWRRAGGRTDVLRGVSLAIEPGDWYCLLGNNGAGKTTVIRIVAGLLRPSSGQVRVEGRDAGRDDARLRHLLGYALADERSFHWRLTTAENLEFFATLVGLSGRARTERVGDLLEKLDLGAQRRVRFGELSTGMKQRLAIARALLGRPRVMLMDEPTRSLDSGHATDTMRVVREEVQAVDGCVLLVTHQLAQALSESDRIGVLHDGVIAHETTATALAEAATGTDGLTISVRGLVPTTIESLRCLPGVQEIRVAASAGGEQVLEVSASNGALQLDRLIAELTDSGASVSGLQRGATLHALLERITREPGGLN